jgi:hypothetical protein
LPRNVKVSILAGKIPQARKEEPMSTATEALRKVRVSMMNAIHDLPLLDEGLDVEILKTPSRLNTNSVHLARTIPVDSTERVGGSRFQPIRVRRGRVRKSSATDHPINWDFAAAKVRKADVILEGHPGNG